MRSYCPENLVALGSTPSPPPPPNIPMADSYFGFQLKKLLLYIPFLFHMYIDMGERIAGKKHRPSLIIKGPLRAHQIATNILQITFLPLYEKLIFNCFPLLYMSQSCYYLWISRKCLYLPGHVRNQGNQWFLLMYVNIIYPLFRCTF